MMYRALILLLFIGGIWWFYQNDFFSQNITTLIDPKTSTTTRALYETNTSFFDKNSTQNMFELTEGESYTYKGNTITFDKLVDEFTCNDDLCNSSGAKAVRVSISNSQGEKETTVVATNVPKVTFADLPISVSQSVSTSSGTSSPIMFTIHEKPSSHILVDEITTKLNISKESLTNICKHLVE